MNRREFIRTTIATATLVAVGATGFFEIFEKIEASQSSQQQAPLATITTGVKSTSTGGLSSSSATSTQSSSPVQSSSSSSGAPAGYLLVGQASSLAGKTSAYFTHPTGGQAILIEVGGEWKAFSATCTHRPCTVEYQSSEIYCPCHGATYNPSNGAVTRGPAPTALGEYGVIIQNGSVFVSSSASG